MYKQLKPLVVTIRRAVSDRLYCRVMASGHDLKVFAYLRGIYDRNDTNPVEVYVSKSSYGGP